MTYSLSICARSLSLQELYAKSREHGSYGWPHQARASHFGTETLFGLLETCVEATPSPGSDCRTHVLPANKNVKDQTADNGRPPERPLRKIRSRAPRSGVAARTLRLGSGQARGDARPPSSYGAFSERRSRIIYRITYVNTDYLLCGAQSTGKWWAGRPAPCGFGPRVPAPVLPVPGVPWR